VTIRERTEQRERDYLSPRAALSAASRGRERPEEPDPIRTAFARDRDRVLHCKSFRRLKHKTQVFLAADNDHYRTRLTHTLEVAQIARTVARALELNEDLTEAIALAHDLGHTPFGHAGERALDSALRELVPDAGFRHDVQSLRVVERLENDGKGLNLTWEVRDGISHHSKGRGDIGEGATAATLEGQVVRVADRIAYLHHDVEDATRAGMLREDDLPEHIRAALGRSPRSRLSALISDLIENSEGRDLVQFSAPVAALLDEMKDFLFERVYSREREKYAQLDVAGIVQRLFEWALKEPEAVPAWMRGVAEAEGLAPEAIRIRAATDFVAGMTDRYAIRLCREVSGAVPTVETDALP
jgi:dGTPase